MEDIKNIWVNPFSVDRVEDWRVEEQPENYKRIAALFAQPDFMGKLEDPTITKAIFITGGRGSGKSHILKRMAMQSEINALEGKYCRKLIINDYYKKYFGVYIKTDCFSPLSRQSINYLDDKQLDALFEHLLNIEVSKSIIDSVKFTIDHFEDISAETETKICNKIEAYLKWGSINSFTDILNYMDCQVNGIVNLTKKILFDNNIHKYINEIDLTKKIPDFILRIYDIISGEIVLLKNKSLILLLDEYESLDVNQQKVINQIIKSRRLTLRIAVKISGVKTLDTKTSERLDEVHDYEVIDLHFKIDQKNKLKYKHLAKNIFGNRLNLKCEYGEYKEKDPEKLLPTTTLNDEGVTEEEIENELIKIKNSLKKNKEIVDSNYWKDFKGHYKKAALFRVLRNKSRDKLYAGFDEYVTLSSGIIRLFIWLCREAFALAHQENIDVMNNVPISVQLQSKAALRVSKNELTVTIPQTINNLYASKLAYFICDIGQILRAKLYYSTQPEANRIEIIDPERFESEDYKIPRELIESGQDLPLFLTETSFKPRDVKNPFPKTFSLNGIFAPLLTIPPQGRWRTELKAEELKGLCLSEHRGEILENIINQIKKKKRAIRKNNKASNKESLPKTGDLFKIIQKPITLENCPVTGKGCNRNLIDYDINLQSSIHAFLAIPFNEGWITDPRRWIKEALLDSCNVVCKDIGDFPALNYFLCKICSCVRQYPFGLFEITELNSNVIFELGMATGLNKTNFLVVYKNKIPSQYKNDFPPSPFNGIEYIPYELNRETISKKIEDKIKPVIEALNKNDNSLICRIIDSQCPHKDLLNNNEKKVFICLPEREKIFDEVYKVIEKLLESYNYILDRHHPAKSLSELCQICRGVKDALFCIIDTTYNDLSMLFAVGVAFGKDKSFILLHDTELDTNRSISDLKKWAIEYKNIQELTELLNKELPKRLNKL